MIDEIWGFFCIIGFWGWVLCTIGLIIKSFPRNNYFAAKAATVWGAAVLFFYSLWVAGMLNT